MRDCRQAKHWCHIFHPDTCSRSYLFTLLTRRPLGSSASRDQWHQLSSPAPTSWRHHTFGPHHWDVVPPRSRGQRAAPVTRVGRHCLASHNVVPARIRVEVSRSARGPADGCCEASVSTPFYRCGSPVSDGASTVPHGGCRGRNGVQQDGTGATLAAVDTWQTDGLHCCQHWPVFAQGATERPSNPPFIYLILSKSHWPRTPGSQLLNAAKKRYNVTIILGGKQCDTWLCTSTTWHGVPQLFRRWNSTNNVSSMLIHW
jgi:hypothetical protein